MTAPRTPHEIRATLDHPVIDADGHFVEHHPEFHRYLEAEGIDGGLAGLWPYLTFDGRKAWMQSTPDERLANRTFRGPWYGLPTRNTRDRATAIAPALLHERLPELGIDLSILYPSLGLALLSARDGEVRRRSCRALNRYVAAHFADFGDRLLPVASIPTITPAEALDELAFATEELGLRAALIGGFAVRDVPSTPGETWIDSLGLDSAYDYDPLWADLARRGVVAGVHSGSMGWSGRRSISNFSYNHLGNFGGASEATAKSLFFGGVLHRFPSLRVAFLEGGVAWAVQQLHDLVGHFHKRGPAGLEAYAPEQLDVALVDALIDKYRHTMAPVTGEGERLRKMAIAPVHHDFDAAGIATDGDIIEQYTSCYAFGCEADDPLASLAFDRKRLPGGRPLAAIFSSDIGHWDVPDMHEVLPEAYENVEHGLMATDEFRDFMCDNTMRLYLSANPAFFAGTVAERYADGLLKGSAGASPARA